MATRQVIVFLGAPGAGKGTQAKLAAERFAFTHISTGDVLREEVRSGSALGGKVRQVMEAGELVSDDLVSEIVQARVLGAAAEQVFILDGYPRNLAQAGYLDAFRDRIDVSVVDFQLEEETAVRRLGGRRYCGGCGRIYNVFFSPSQREGVCDACQTALQHRKDDLEDVVKERFRVYRQQTAPLTEYYESRPNYFKVDGNRDADRVAEDVVQIIGRLQAEWSTVRS
jgi:adenylate kinase